MSMWAENQSVEDRLVEMARELAARTRAGAIEWKRSGPKKRYLFSGGNGSVSIEGPDNPMSGGRVTLRLLDSAGQEIERLAGSSTSTSVTGFQIDQALRELFEAVDQTNHRAMSLIDSILDDVRHR